MTHLHIDFETRSTVELKKTGTPAYAEDPTTDLWCACFCFGDGPVQTWRPGQPCPDEIALHVIEGGIIYAHNAAFEQTLWRYVLTPRYGWPLPETEQWRCTMSMAYAMALPGALDDAAQAAGIDHRKDAAGSRLMLQMARPRRLGPPIAWWDDEAKVERLIAYCRQDVEVERQLADRLRPLKESELALWHLDQKVNERGVFVDVALCNAAKKIVAVTAAKLDDEMRAVTGGAVGSCSSVAQLIAFARERGVETDSIAKDILEELLALDTLDPVVRRALELRREAAKASVAKIDALLRGRSKDGRARHLLQFHAASTGRWAGRRFQPQNLKRPILDDIDSAIGLVMEGDADLIEMIYGAPLSVVGDCLRGMIAAAPGKKIVAADYANIEGRVLAWLAGEAWKLDAFRAYDAGTGPDLYKVAYSRAFGMAPDAVTKPQRQVGKVMELALGYQGGVGAFQTMAVNYGVRLPDTEVERIRDGWRASNPAIKQFWWELERAAIAAVRKRGVMQTVGEIRLKVAGSFLFMRLPSGRFLTYPYPEIRPKLMPWKTDDGSEVWKDALTYFSTIDVSKRFKIVEDPLNTSKWARIATYGGMLAENATQAVARDVLADAMPRLESAGYPLVLSVHDELVCEVDQSFGSVDEMVEIMVALPSWASGLPVAAEGFEGARYRK